MQRNGRPNQWGPVWQCQECGKEQNKQGKKKVLKIDNNKQSKAPVPSQQLHQSQYNGGLYFENLLILECDGSLTIPPEKVQEGQGLLYKAKDPFEPGLEKRQNPPKTQKSQVLWEDNPDQKQYKKIDETSKENLVAGAGFEPTTFRL